MKTLKLTQVYLYSLCKAKCWIPKLILKACTISLNAQNYIYIFKVTWSIENIKQQSISDITLMTLLINRLTLYSRKYLKSARPCCTDFNYYLYLYCGELIVSVSQLNISTKILFCLTI